MDIVAQIVDLYSQLSQSEQKVADVILVDLEVAAEMNITQLAEKSKVSKASVTRLAKTIGCANVRELKLELARSAAVGKRFIKESNEEIDDTSGIFETIKAALDINARLLSVDNVKQVAQLVVAAEQVVVFGTGGGSTAMAMECQYRMFRLGVRITSFSDNVLMRMASASLGKNDVVICLSLTGCNPELESAIKIAKEYHATVIAIAPVDSKITTLADFTLPIQLNESDYIYKPSASRYVMMANIDVLATEVAIKNKRKSREKLRRIKKHLDDYRQSNLMFPIGD